MDNSGDAKALAEGARALGVALPEGAPEALLWLRAELLRWNAKVNLTAITDPGEVLEKHLLDSLAAAPEVAGAPSLLDLGAGAGFPGLPLALALPAVQVVLIEAAAKKVAFMKGAIAHLKLPNARARRARAAGRPDEEGIARAAAVVSRALMDVGRWVPFAARYAAPGGRVLAMVARPPPREELEAVAEASGLVFEGARAYRLPRSGAERAVLSFARPG